MSCVVLKNERIVYQSPNFAIIRCRCLIVGGVLEGGFRWRVESSEFRRVCGVRWISVPWASAVRRRSIGVVFGGVLRGNMLGGPAQKMTFFQVAQK